MEIRDRKAAQRRAGIMARRGLPQAERAAANAAICARILAMPCFQKAENLLLYAAFGGEVDLAVLAEQAARLGKTVAYPVCGENFTLTAAVPGPDLSLIHISSVSRMHHILNMFSTKQEVLSPAPCMAPLATMEAPNMGSAQASMRKT